MERHSSKVLLGDLGVNVFCTASLIVSGEPAHELGLVGAEVGERPDALGPVGPEASHLVLVYDVEKIDPFHHLFLGYTEDLLLFQQVGQVVDMEFLESKQVAHHLSFLEGPACVHFVVPLFSFACKNLPYLLYWVVLKDPG